jgi:guanylate kinase
MSNRKILGNLSKGLLFVMSAPAGTGKTTLVEMLKEEFECITGSISCTTRPPRPGETPGKDYYFLSIEEFNAKIEAGDFLEYAQVFGNYYGTSQEYVSRHQLQGKHVVLVIDTQGAMQLQGKVSAIFIFIAPPSLHELRERLVKRKTESPELIEERLSWAKQEIALAAEYDYLIVNDELSIAYEGLRSIFIAEERRIHRCS